MAKIYYDNDARMEILFNKTIGFIGYGNQGRSQALNLKDSGIKNVIIGSRRGTSFDRAANDGFQVFSIHETSQKADILFILIPDEVAPEIYKQDIEPFLTQNKVLNFSSGYNVTFNRIIPPKHTDVIMVAPRMIGEGVRELYVSGEGYPAFVSVRNNASGNARDIAIAIARAIGATKKGAIEVTFEDETFLDLIAEQATWPLIISVLTEIYRYAIEMGHPEEAVLIELYMSGEPAVMMEKMATIGFFKQLSMHSHTSQYGQLSRCEKVDKNYIRNFIKEQYEYIRNGNFATEWDREKKNNLAELKNLLSRANNSGLSVAEERVFTKLKYKNFSYSSNTDIENLVRTIVAEILSKISIANGDKRI